MFTLAHLSDPHLGPLPRPTFRELFSKRILGYTNWRVRRRGRHDMTCLAALTQDLLAQKCDHIAVTGDLAVIGLDAEFVPARAFLETLGSPDHVSAIPGNHDVYVSGTADHPQLHWAEYMAGDNERVVGSPFFPYVRRRGNVALIGLSSAVPTGFHSAQGRLGKEQCYALTDILRQLDEEGLFRIVMIHHPPSGTGDVLRRLTDARRIKRSLLRAGAELVLHGHNHRHERISLLGRTGPVPVIGVPSASIGPGHPHSPGAYNIYRIDGEKGAWRCEMISRGFAPGDGEITERSRTFLCGADIPAASGS
ncbi:metallophosphoesterase family protein [Terrihabitans sp. B22-R8]|uniref:metallophosphoesterase family protein n=1 Tax=Terrihabitans sp. B22-R8 TaxID=3425128 RepID=UPI00403C976D